MFTPTVPDHGWSAAAHTVVEVVTDDMPFLVDSTTMALAEDGRTVHVVIHPLFEVVRDVAGELRSVRGGDEGHQALTNDHESTGQVDQGGLETVQESWMHIEIDRVTDEDELAAIEARLQRVLRDNRDAVEDWPRMQAKLAEIVEELEAAPPTLPDPTELGRGTDFLRWLGDDHFAFLGYREYSLVEDGDELALSAVPGTGLGILRGDQLQSSAFQKLPEAVRERAKEPRLLVLAKANSKATVHRQAYLDYVGVKKFDENDQVVGERRFLGLFSSATYTESVLRIPALKEKVDEVLAALRHRAAQPHRQAAAQRAGELPARRALPDPDRRADPDRRGGDAHPRAPPAAAVRTPRHLPPLRVLPRLPSRATATTPPCASGWRRSCPRRWAAGASSSPCASTRPTWPRCTSWCARPRAS